VLCSGSLVLCGGLLLGDGAPPLVVGPTRKITRYIPGFGSPKSRVDGGETPSQTAVKRPQHTGFPGIYMDAGFSTGLQGSHRNPGSVGL